MDSRTTKSKRYGIMHSPACFLCRYLDLERSGVLCTCLPQMHPGPHKPPQTSVIFRVFGWVKRMTNYSESSCSSPHSVASCTWPFILSYRNRQSYDKDLRNSKSWCLCCKRQEDCLDVHPQFFIWLRLHWACSGMRVIYPNKHTCETAIADNPQLWCFSTMDFECDSGTNLPYQSERSVSF